MFRLNYNEAIYGYITSIWKASKLSKRKFAIHHNIEESTLRDIVNGNGYQVSLPTLYKICESRNMLLSEFFREVESWQEGTRK